MKNNKHGFSLVELMVVVAGMGGLLVLSMNLSSQFHQNQVSNDARFETLEMRRLVTTFLFEEKACSNTFSGKRIGDPVTEIKNAFPNGGKTVFDLAKNGTSNVKVQSMRLILGDPNPDGTPNVVLSVDFKKSKEKDRNHYAPILVPLKVNLNPAGLVTSCRVNSDKFVLKSGDEMTGPLTTPSLVSTTGVVATLNVLAARFCTGSVCRAISELALNNQLCGANQISRGVRADGTLDCVDLQFSCGANQAIQAITSSGAVVCGSLGP
ncbi:prepilin-type N-terminal cleavage/methylation domain-containing protein [Peredibacter starrii]|uniref:Prepilin-type N-terminal cleavage/methylation domain-containing protein n=1 Tax=Peredibacter starrii TaxID=28202 RepID=A0AAX4HKH7_9BACT|nr:prepilin-type N-terminal cleavage/methylation domain-containing protein [Peredibacter starrii]WPU63713.1 prepilin-type N-terminal cleavage/methylation domain-containing protein [Peredibacter starrii]